MTDTKLDDAARRQLEQSLCEVPEARRADTALGQTGRRADWVYADRYLEMLQLTYPDSLPIVCADWEFC